MRPASAVWATGRVGGLMNGDEILSQLSEVFFLV